jgi:soluble lytic murein transglycosylase
VMENMQVYRARLGGGSGPLTLTADLKRGAAAYASVAPSSSPVVIRPDGVVTMQPIP